MTPIALARNHGTFKLSVFMPLILFSISLAVFFIKITARFSRIQKGTGSFSPCSDVTQRLIHCLGMTFGHRRIAEKWWGKLHIIIFYTFFVFLLSTIEILIQSAFPAFVLSDIFGYVPGNVIYLIQNYFAVICLMAVVVLSIRRFVLRKTLRSTFEAWFILGLIGCIMVSQFGVMASHIFRGETSDWLDGMLPLSSWIANHIWDCDLVYTVSTYLHILCTCIFLICIPDGKHLHIVMAFPNLFFQYRMYDGKRPVVGIEHTDMQQYENALENALNQDIPEDEWPVVGALRLKDLSKKTRMECLACSQCQRCTNVCPMVRAGMANCSGPMQQMLNLRQMMIARRESDALVPDVLPSDELWSCTQCGACDRACAVGVEHTSRMIRMRQAGVCRENMPRKLNGIFSAMERSGNPWGYGRSIRLSPPETNGKGREDLPSVLFFMGCMANYDSVTHRTAVHAVSWLQDQGFRVSVMTEESCCGESMRKLGNEAAFEQCRQRNLDRIKEIPHDIILSICPHCVQTLGNDYADREDVLNVKHFWAFLADLYEDGHLDIKQPKDRQNRILQMPCLLGKQPLSPRNMLEIAEKLGITLADDDVSRSMCCGGGGGQFLLDQSREIPQLRVSELIGQSPDQIVTACPYCTQMINGELVRENNSDSQPDSQPNSFIETINVVDILADLSTIRG